MTSSPRISRNLISVLSCGLLAFALALPVEAQRAPGKREEDKPATKQTQALSAKVYEVLVKAQEYADANKYEEAFQELRKLEGRRFELTPYELAQMHSFYAFIYYQREDYPGAIRSYETVLAQPDIPEGMRINSIYSLGQLYFTVENYDKCIQYLGEWFTVAQSPNPEAYILLSQAYYQKGQYRRALEPLDQAIALNAEKGREIKESWLLLKRVYHYQLQEYQKVAEVLNQLIALYPKREYWNQLSSVYGELDDPKRQLAVLELANMQGYLDRERDQTNLAQLYMMNGVPVKGAEIIQEGLGNGTIATNLKNLRLLAQAWGAAQERDKEIDVLKQAAPMASDGRLFLQLAYGLINTDRTEEAIEAIRSALDRGGLRDRGGAQVLLGQGLFELKRYDEARKAFESAQSSGSSSSQRQADNWLSHLKKDQQRRQLIADAIKKAAQDRADAAAETDAATGGSP